MSGTKIGGKRASEKNRALYGEDYYKRIGMKGGQKGRTGGFFGDPQRARQWGSIGGQATSAKIWKDHTKGIGMVNCLCIHCTALLDARKARLDQLP